MTRALRGVRARQVDIARIIFTDNFMTDDLNSNYVFLTDCNDFSQAQVVKSYLISLGFHPRVRDEQTRTVAPHFENLLGKLRIDIPGYEFLAASAALEKLESSPAPDEQNAGRKDDLQETQALAKKALANAILGCVFIPLLCNFYSIYLALIVLKKERPLSPKSRSRITWSVIFNALAFYIWFLIGPRYFLGSY